MCCDDGSLGSLDGGSAKQNGVVQIVAGGVSILFTIAALIVANGLAVHTGIWCGVFFVLGGVAMLIAGIKRSFAWTVAALVLAVSNISFSLVHFLFSFAFLYSSRFQWDNILTLYPLFLFFLALVMLAAYAQVFSVFWAIVIASRAFYYRCVYGVDGAMPEVHRNHHANNAWMKANWVAQILSTCVCVGFTIFILLAFNYMGDPSYDVFNNQSMGVSLWCAPFYLLGIYLGFRSWRFGENSSLISFLVVNVLQLALCPWEVVGSSLAIMFGWCEEHGCDPNGYPSLLAALNSTVIGVATLHFLFSIWAIALAVVYIIRDNACSCCVTDGCCVVGGSTGDCDKCCFGNQDEMHAGSAVQPYAVKTEVAVEAGTGTRYILRPVNAGEMPNNAGEMPNNAGDMPNNPG